MASGHFGDLHANLARARDQYREALVLQRQATALLKAGLPNAETSLIQANHAVAFAAGRYEEILREFIARAIYKGSKQIS